MDCLQYGNTIYKPEILFDKIRQNPEFFIKKHGITGYHLEQVLGREGMERLGIAGRESEPQFSLRSSVLWEKQKD